MEKAEVIAEAEKRLLSPTSIDPDELKIQLVKACLRDIADLEAQIKKNQLLISILRDKIDTITAPPPLIVVEEPIVETEKPLTEF